MNCPNCNQEMRLAFSNRASGLSCADPAQFGNFFFMDVDLFGAGLRKLLPWKAEWYRAHRCEVCCVCTIEYGQAYSRREVEAMIARIEDDAAHRL